MKDTVIRRLAAGTAAAGLIYGCGRQYYINHFSTAQVSDDEEAELIELGDTKFDKATAAQEAADAWGPEEQPTLPQFLAHFFCGACSRRCLLIMPACGNGKNKQEQAAAIYDTLYTE